MSVVVRSRDDNKIILMTKGADSVIYERLAVVPKVVTRQKRPRNTSTITPPAV